LHKKKTNPTAVRAESPETGKKIFQKDLVSQKKKNYDIDRKEKEEVVSPEPKGGGGNRTEISNPGEPGGAGGGKEHFRPKVERMGLLSACGGRQRRTPRRPNHKIERKKKRNSFLSTSCGRQGQKKEEGVMAGPMVRKSARTPGRPLRHLAVVRDR